jgi:uncharacterized protein GlcG (DUF336 family)
MRTRKVLDQDDVRGMLIAAEKHARTQGWIVSIAVYDESGHLAGFTRMDGASPFTVDMSQQKARTAALTRRESRHYEQVIRERPAFLSAPVLEGMVEGGVPIMLDGECLGAVGASGVTSQQDAEIARAGIAALTGVA